MIVTRIAIIIDHIYTYIHTSVHTYIHTYIHTLHYITLHYIHIDICITTDGHRDWIFPADRLERSEALLMVTPGHWGRGRAALQQGV